MNPLEFDQLKSIFPAQIKSYLLDNQWIEDGELDGLATIWHRENEDEFEFEVLLPENPELQDYSRRILDAIESLADYENRKVASVLKDIANHFSDLVSIRVVHSDVEGGTIPLEDGVRLFERARDLLASAALSTISKKRYFYGSRPYEASTFLSGIRLGQTEIGSYIVNVVIPLSIADSNQLVESVSFSRTVTATLSNSLGALKGLVDEDSGSIETVEKLVQGGVSANMCDALVGLSGENKSRGFEIYISYSNSEREKARSPSSHSFKSKDVPKIEKISEYLKENYVIENVTVSGNVKKLDRSADDTLGTVTIVAFVAERERAVSFELPTKEYHDAVLAHDRQFPVEITGDIHIAPRSAKLLNGSGFRVFGNGSLFE